MNTFTYPAHPYLLLDQNYSNINKCTLCTKYLVIMNTKTKEVDDKELSTFCRQYRQITHQKMFSLWINQPIHNVWDDQWGMLFIHYTNKDQSMGNMYSMYRKICTQTFNAFFCVVYIIRGVNKKMSSYQYRISHCGDKTILRPSYLHNGISYTERMTSLYWNSAQASIDCFDLFTHFTMVAPMTLGQPYDCPWASAVILKIHVLGKSLDTQTKQSANYMHIARDAPNKLLG